MEKTRPGKRTFTSHDVRSANRRQHAACIALQRSLAVNGRVGSKAERLTASKARPQHPNNWTKCCDPAVFRLGPNADIGSEERGSIGTEIGQCAAERGNHGVGSGGSAGPNMYSVILPMTELPDLRTVFRFKKELVTWPDVEGRVPGIDISHHPIDAVFHRSMRIRHELVTDRLFGRFFPPALSVT
jgi:hypothetical protein